MNTLLSADALRCAPPLAAAVAVLCWPSRPVAHRLHRIFRGTRRRPSRRLVEVAVPAVRRLSRHPRAGLVCAIVVGATGFLACGVGVGLAAALLVATTAGSRRRARAARAQASATRAVADALGGLVAELRAGSHPAAAAEGAAEDADGPVAAALRAAAATARLGGPVAPTLRRIAAADPVLAAPLGRLARAWALADRHGIALADLLADVRRDLDHRLRFTGQVGAAMTGPRTTAGVLTLLPVFGVLLGEALGAQPIRLLTGPPAGQTLLVAGVVLLCTGVRWADALISRAVRP